MRTVTAAFNHQPIPGRRLRISPVAKEIALTDEDIIKREMGEYEKNKADFLAKYEGKYIAMLNGNVLDSDPELSNLATRVYAKFGYQAIFMTLVSKREKPYKIATPKFK